MARRLRAVPADRLAAAAALAARECLATPEFRAAHSVALYAALDDEVPTRPLFDAASAAGKRCLLPRCVDDVLEFAEVEQWDELQPGRFGVPAPPAHRAPRPPSELELVVLPGRAFDRLGNRLGRGQGYYDRTFGSRRPGSPVLLGLAYQVQLVETVPRGPDDRAVDLVVTEVGVVRCPSQGVAG